MTATSTHCLNCQSPLDGKYCAQCGQAANTSVPTLRELFADYLNGLYNLDSRLWVSLGNLFIRPAFLTREYLAGRRAGYITPFKLYLIMSVFYFLLTAIMPGEVQIMDANNRTSTPERCAGGFPDLSPENREIFVSTCEKVLGDLDGFVRQLINRLPTLMFLSLPVMAMVMFPLYWFDCRRRYIEHLVQLLHTNASLFCWWSLLHIAGLVVHENWMIWPHLLVITIIPWRALRGVYGQTPLVTSIKYLLLLLANLFILAIGMLLLMIYTALTY